jgi:DNA-binding GntR family transcriptional regulator
VPPAARVETDLRRRVGAGEWASGEALPAMAALAVEYGVSRASVAKALRRLADDGLVEIVPQWGTFRT